MAKNGHNAKAIAHAKNKIAQNMQKPFLQTHSSCSKQKTGSKKQVIFEK